MSFLHLLVVAFFTRTPQIQGTLGRAVRLSDDPSLSAEGRRELVASRGFQPVPSDDGTTLFTPLLFGSYADKLAIPTMARISDGHVPTYLVEVLKNPIRSYAWSIGQFPGKAGGYGQESPRIWQRPYSPTLELHTAHNYGALLAAKSRMAWIDGRICDGSFHNQSVSYLVISAFQATETLGARNASGLIPFEGRPIAAAYGPGGRALVSCSRFALSDRSLVTIETYALHGSTVRPWKRASWPTFVGVSNAPSPLSAAFFGDVVGVQPITGRSAAVTSLAIEEWDPSRGRMNRRFLPANTKAVKLAYAGGHLLLQTVNRSPQDEAAGGHAHVALDPSSVKLYEAKGSGWEPVGPYYIHGVSENGRFVVVRNVVDNTWWEFDTSVQAER